MGNEVLRLGLFEEDNLKAVALISKIKARRGKFYLIQHGPVIKNSKLQTNSKQIPNSKYIIR